MHEWEYQISRRFRVLERQVIEWAKRWEHPKLDVFFHSLSQTAHHYVWFALSGILLLAHSLDSELLPMQTTVLNGLFMAGLINLLGHILKVMIRRPRPFTVIPGIVAKDKVPHWDSFPSNHVATSVAFHWLLLSGAHPWSHWVAVWAGGLAISRIYLGVHYLGDVLGGFLVGYLASMALTPFVMQIF